MTIFQGLLFCIGAIVATTVSAVLLYLIDRTSTHSDYRRHWMGYLALLAAVAVYGSIGAGRMWSSGDGILYVLPMCALTVGYGIWCAWRNDQLYLPFAFAAWLCFAIAWIVAAPTSWLGTLGAVTPACILSVSAGGVPLALRTPPR